jgi:hypothetical protein
MDFSYVNNYGSLFNWTCQNAPNSLHIKACLKACNSLSNRPIRATYRDEARHGRAFAGLLERYFGK